MMPRPFDSLVDALAVQPPETATVTLTLVEIEALLGRPLPAGAWARQYWRNRSHDRSWLRTAGWRVSGFDRHGLVVTFARATPDSTP